MVNRESSFILFGALGALAVQFMFLFLSAPPRFDSGLGSLGDSAVQFLSDLRVSAFICG
jgi:hypothetical protein